MQNASTGGGILALMSNRRCGDSSLMIVCAGRITGQMLARVMGEVK